MVSHAALLHGMQFEAEVARSWTRKPVQSVDSMFTLTSKNAIRKDSHVCLLYIPDFPVEAIVRAEPLLRERAVAVLEGEPPVARVVALNDKLALGMKWEWKMRRLFDAEVAVGEFSHDAFDADARASTRSPRIPPCWMLLSAFRREWKTPPTIAYYST